MLVAALNGKVDVIRLLLAKGADPNGHFRSKTALHTASQKGYLDCVVALVEAGADVNAPMTSGDTPVHLAKSGKHLDVAEYLMAHGVTQPKPEPISAKLGTADAIEGRKAFENNCEKCHFVEPEKGQKVGPNLWSMVGRERALMPGNEYSDALKSWHGVWTYEDLNAFLWKPKVTVPGVLMEIAGLDDEAERINLIAYLRTLSDGPEPLP